MENMLLKTAATSMLMRDFMMNFVFMSV